MARIEQQGKADNRYDIVLSADEHSNQARPATLPVQPGERRISYFAVDIELIHDVQQGYR